MAFVQTVPYATLRGDRVEAYGGLGALEGLVLLRDGRRVAAYGLEALIARPRIVSLSISHVRWLRETESLEGPLVLELVLETTSFRRQRFDTRTGEQRATEDLPEWTRCDLIAYGELHVDGAALRMEPAFAVKGAVAKRLPLAAATGLRLDPGYQTLCMKRSGNRLLATEVLEPLNGVTAP